MIKKLLGRKLLFIVAHPDDESFTAAGTIVKNKAAGGESAIICVTRGEKGQAHLKKPIPARKFKHVRTRELERAARFLKIKKLQLLNFPDREVSENKGAIYKKVLPLARRLDPEVIVSFGPDGISGHLDHIAIGAVSKKIARTLRVPFIAFAAPPHLIENVHHLKKRRKFGAYSRRLRHRAHNLRIPIDPKIKLKALGYHSSQIESKNPFSWFEKRVMKHILHFEYFVIED